MWSPTWPLRTPGNRFVNFCMFVLEVDSCCGADCAELQTAGPDWKLCAAGAVPAAVSGHVASHAGSPFPAPLIGPSSPSFTGSSAQTRGRDFFTCIHMKGEKKPLTFTLVLRH